LHVRARPTDRRHRCTPSRLHRGEPEGDRHGLPAGRAGRIRPRHVSTQVYTGDAPAGCDVILTYTALRSWDFAPYLSHAELHLKTRDGAEIASAEYHLVGKGGYSLMKWQGTKTKMDPVVDELLKAY
jgi:hypothetical protein